MDKSMWLSFLAHPVYQVITQKRYKLTPKLLQNVNTKSYALYRMVPFVLTFQGHSTFQRCILETKLLYDANRKP